MMEQKLKDIYKYSNPEEVRKNAKQLYGKYVIIQVSDKKDKKYKAINTLTGETSHFGAYKMQDFTKHRDKGRRDRYLKRALNIKGDWRKDPMAPNNLAIFLLWRAKEYEK